MKVVNALGKVIKAISVIDGIIIVALMIFISIDIVWRLCGGGIKGSVEIVTNAVPIIVFLGVGYTMYQESHIRVDVFKAQILDRICNLVVLATCLLLVWMTYNQGMQTKSLGTSTTILHIPKWPFVICSSFGFLLVSIALILIEVRAYIGLANAHKNKKLGIKEEA